MAAHTKLWYFERFGLIQALNDTQRRHFAGMARMFELKRGSRIYLPGDPGDHVFLLKAGVVKIARDIPDQGEVILTFLYPGDIFGELAVVDGAPRDHMAEAHEDAIICALARDTVLQMIQGAPALGFEITRLIGRRLQRLQSRIEELLCKSAPTRVAHALLDLADSYGIKDADGVLIPLRLSQSDIGRLVGLRRETVNTILQEWRERGLVEAGRRAIRVRDIEGLRRVS
jgi:CRP/FNR family transcriptional regulator, cyclic AMP receptor protein